MSTCYVTGWAYPIRFTSTGDITTEDNEAVINNNVILSVFVRENNIPLMPLGVGIDDFIFEPADAAMEAELSFRIKDAVDAGVSGVSVDHDNITLYDDDDNQVRIVVPYLSMLISKSFQTVIAINRHNVD